MAHMNSDFLHARQDDPECPVWNVLLLEQSFEGSEKGDKPEVRSRSPHVNSCLHALHRSMSGSCLLADHRLESPSISAALGCCRLSLRMDVTRCRAVG